MKTSKLNFNQEPKTEVIHHLILMTSHLVSEVSPPSYKGTNHIVAVRTKDYAVLSFIQSFEKHTGHSKLFIFIYIQITKATVFSNSLFSLEKPPSTAY